MTLRVIEVQAVDADAEAALWSYLFGIDLVGTVQAVDRPVDDPLRWRLADPRRLRVREVRDHLWVRLVDVAAALAAAHLRHGGRPGDRARRRVPPRQQRPVADRRWTRRCRVRAHRPHRGRPHPLAPELGALYLGGVAPSTLAAAGRITRAGPSGALRRADRFFVAHPSPWCTTHF